jgi:predicted 3-demethylubiquinone-9 3-methyltransferase (glyoxalase superfamily)
MQRITPCLWFNDNAETAVKFLHRHLQELEDQHRHPLR